MSSFNLPVFNLPCFIWHGGKTNMGTLPIPDLEVMGNLANGRIAHLPVWQPRPPALSTQTMSSCLLFPKGTDVRDISTSNGPDVVECPKFSGRFYWVTYVDDIGKGFSNEHRWCVVQKVFTYGAFSIYRWPSPIP